MVRLGRKGGGGRLRTCEGDALVEGGLRGVDEGYGDLGFEGGYESDSETLHDISNYFLLFVAR